MKLNKEMLGLDDITKMLNDITELDERMGYTSKELVSGRSCVFTIAVLHLLLKMASAFEEQRDAA
jgi:hypothetical protein